MTGDPAEVAARLDAAGRPEKSRAVRDGARSFRAQDELTPDGPGGLSLPTGEVRAGEHYLLDACLRIPLETAGFRPQMVHPFALAGAVDDHLFVWVDGDRYTGRRPHRQVDLVTGAAEVIAARLEAADQPGQARALRDGARPFQNQDERGYYADSLRMLEPAYLRATTPEQGRVSAVPRGSGGPPGR